MKQHPFAKAREIAARFRAEAKGDGLFSKVSADVGELYLYDSIGEDWWSGGGITAQKIVDALKAMEGVKTLDIFINSPGGDVFEAKAIYENLRRFDAEKVVHIDGIAASAATFIAMAGTKIITASPATWMVHEVSAFAWGRAAEMRAMAEVLDIENRAIASIYAARTGKTEAEMLDLMAAETWMSAKDALAKGFTDEVAEPAKPLKKEEPATAAARIEHFEAATQRIIDREHRARSAAARHTRTSRASPAKRNGQPSAP